jgi:hypothetical protein
MLAGSLSVHQHKTISFLWRQNAALAVCDDDGWQFECA